MATGPRAPTDVETRLVRELEEAFARLAEMGGIPAIGGHLRVESGSRTRDVLIGSRSVPGRVPVLDWRTAPLAEVFFRHRVGDEYAIEVDGRDLEGVVVGRHRLRAPGGRLVEITGDDVVLVRGADGAWSARSRPAAAVPAATSGGKLEIVLDDVQRGAVEQPDDVSLVVDGEAGVGKTVVAVWRLARLRERRPDLRALVLVPTEGLRRLVRQLADRAGVGPLEIALLDDWLVARARAALRGLPERTSEDATASVIRLKRHPAVRDVLDEVIARPRARDDDERRLPRARADLLHLWGDRVRVERVAVAAGLGARAVADVLAHTRTQFTSTTEEAHTHVDADRLIATDGRALDAGTPMGDAGTFDAEDAPVLLELARRRRARPAAPLATYDHVVVDEAQLVAPLELAAIGAALAPGGTFTLSGDHRQETDDSAWFAGWPAAVAEVAAGAGAARRHVQVTLAHTYRSVPPIADFARALADRPPAAVPASPAVWATAAASALDAAADVVEHLAAVRARDPALTVAVIARNADHARRVHHDLERGLDATLVLDGAFPFTPGVVVTTITEVQGLEFDAVVVPDAAPGYYPAAPDARHALYVAVTRARTWLWLVTATDWSPLIDAAAGAPG